MELEVAIKKLDYTMHLRWASSLESIVTVNS